ncbi:uncharacterized protein VNE69_10115 [Vairimorpha necatrix]|uniref:Uncharacterized protein n=1 Tax=Vairimorpha necatrix TaxID=6039 RepID=A0AAX4JFG8_9MICR
MINPYINNMVENNDQPKALYKEFKEDEIELVDVYRLFQKKDQNAKDFIDEVKKKSKVVKMDSKESMKIVMLGIRREFPNLRAYITSCCSLNDIDLKRVLMMEKIDKELNDKIRTILGREEKGNMKSGRNGSKKVRNDIIKQKYDNKKQLQINEVLEDSEEIINKENLYKNNT